MQKCNENTHTDRMDVSFEISLNEYGIVRNPVNDDTVFCLNPTNDIDEKHRLYSSFDISFNDVSEALDEAEKGYFDFIGSEREKELKELNNDYLAIHIFSLNQYNGYFDPHRYQ